MDGLLTTYRRDLHQIPELDTDLPETTAYLRRVLEGLPCRVFSPDDRGLCAYFDGGKARTAAWRADMDALPIVERSGAPYASRHPGKMHACGHDGHMAMALGLAGWTAEHLAELPRNVLFVFQPAEETTGGARLICASGVFSEHRVERIFGFHLWPDLPAGQISSRPGPLLARASEVTVDITGKSAHIAKWREGDDALLAAARFLCGADRAMEDLRRTAGPCLLKFGRMESGTVRNAISAHSQILGSLRVFSDDAFDRAKALLEGLGRTVGEETGTAFRVGFSTGYPPVRNDEDLLRRAEAALPGLSILPEPLLIAEDFAFYQQILPGLFLLLGTGTGIPLHADTFDFDESILAAGVAAGQKLLSMD
ncbi:amidohydrolase [Pseudoflavonifractor sp. MSJ-37]|uniref:amidohydrolase n=1 Tax=Pseudoflavonifractor sp. MSJ-37 TaxID=2841531 RepID=UPI001C10A431|nr:amidohydrolase [Pseudoflavonifractor sp. MSJ-37]MBU5435247.1 amidohydrolase [Pseudoflavonifractor sp. MSJ-37]